MINSAAITDLQRMEFLRKLHASPLRLSEWEQNFIYSYRMAPRKTLWFTNARRATVDRMRMKYGGEPEIGLPLVADTTAPVTVAPADPVGCMYFKREDGRQFHCNEPATLQRKNGFRYCEACADLMRVALKRRGETIHLYPFP